MRQDSWREGGLQEGGDYVEVKKTGDATIDHLLAALGELTAKSGSRIEIADNVGKVESFFGLAQDCCN